MSCFLMYDECQEDHIEHTLLCCDQRQKCPGYSERTATTFTICRKDTEMRKEWDNL